MMAFQLLLLLIGGVSGQSTQTIQRGAGETVTVHCDYGEDYKNYGKIWCRETGRNICNTILITSLQRGVPRVNATSGRTLISDNKETQQISVTVQKLEKPDTGVYWCGVYFNYTKEVQIMKRIVLRISEDFTNFRVRMPTASTDESQDEDIKDNSEGASSLLAMTPGMVTAFFAGILLGKVLVAVAGYMIMKRRATMERGKNTRKRERSVL
ncbi:trem-like transcript 4 protein isoform X2 [Pleurodeles waltl]|uniref:trem-like transcript 4 protein isoform X2 n=1 Tax=Pleurodeles waltl TaxID=8319 RepID=UPI003709AD7E